LLKKIYKMQHLGG